MRYFLAVLAIVTAATGFATAQTNRPISQAVQVCDPRYPERCIKPDSSGAITASISGTLTAIVTSATVQQGTSPWIVSGTITNVTGTVSTGTNDGSNIAQGARADTVCSTATGTCSIVALIKYLNNAVNSAIPAGSNIIGSVSINQTTPGSTNAVVVTAATTGASTPNRIITTASTNCASIKASPGTLYGVTAITTSATVNWVKYYNITTTPSTAVDTPIMSFAIPASASGAGFTNPIPAVGVNFGTGIGRCVTGGYIDLDNTNAVAGTIVNEMYK